MTMLKNGVFMNIHVEEWSITVLEWGHPLACKKSNDFSRFYFFKYTLHMMLRRYRVILRIKPHNYLVPDHGCNNPYRQHMIKQYIY